VALGKLAAQLELRKAIMRGARPPRAGVAAVRPPGARLFEREYERRMLAMWATFREHVHRAARQDLRSDSTDSDLRDILRVLMRASGVLNWLDGKAAQTLDTQARYVERVTRIPPAGARAGRQAAIEAFREENARLITRMGDDQISQVMDLLRPAQAVGQRWEELAPQIDKRLNVGASRAKLIARDQTNKFNGSMQRLTQEASGITKYRWSTSRDFAVRGRPGGEYPTGEDHWVLEGQVFTWANPPLIPGTSERAHPGQRPQCRCVATPVVDFFESSGAPQRTISVPAPTPVVEEPRVAELPSPIPQDLTKGGKLPLRATSFAHLRGGGAVTQALPVSIAVYPDGTVFPRDGRHRITLARERGQKFIEGDVIRVGKRGGEKVEKKVRIPI
jgi:SPP1 gp7 family putative phage head morphogenesis protein